MPKNNAEGRGFRDGLAVLRDKWQIGPGSLSRDRLCPFDIGGAGLVQAVTERSLRG